MEKIKPYNYKSEFGSINYDTNPKNNNLNFIQEDEFISLINSLSSVIKEYFFSVSNILEKMKTHSFNLNKYILTSKCLINEMNNKINIKERMRQFNKNIEGINISNKYINNNISLLEMNLNKLFNNSKFIFKKMKNCKNNKFRTLSEINNNSSINSNKNQIILEQNNINQYNNKIKFLKLSLDTNKISSFSNTNKSNSNNTSSRKDWNTKKNKNRNTINLSQRNIKHKNSDLYLDDIDYFEQKMNKNKDIFKEKSNRFRKKRNNSQNNITTDLRLNRNIYELKNLLENSPDEKRISISTQKITPLWTNFNNYNYYYPYKNKYLNLGNNTERRNDEFNNFDNFKKFIIKEKPRININSCFSENSCIKNICILLINLVEYFYLLSQYQNNIIGRQCQRSPPCCCYPSRPRPR